MIYFLVLTYVNFSQELLASLTWLFFAHFQVNLKFLNYCSNT